MCLATFGVRPLFVAQKPRVTRMVASKVAKSVGDLVSLLSCQDRQNSPFSLVSALPTSDYMVFASFL